MIIKAVKNMTVGYCFDMLYSLISDKINGDLCHVLSPFYYI